MADTGRTMAWAGFLAGSVVSLAANVAHARPDIGPRVAGAVWPALLLLSVEVLAHNRWPSGRRWAAAGTTLVALVAGLLSYEHMAGLLVRYGEGVVTAHLGPLAVDGLMVVCGSAILSVRATVPDTEPAPMVAPERPDRAASPTPPPGPAPTSRPARAQRVRKPATPSSSTDPDVSDLHPAIDEIHADRGPALNREQLLTELKSRGLAAGGNRKKPALAYYRSLSALHTVQEVS